MKTIEQLGISPAPWKHTPADEWTHAGIDDANGCGVGETYQVPRSDEGTETANACICAAAPELYSALFEMVEMYRDGGSYDYEQEVIKKAKAALAKAAGESEVKE